ncbi:MAG: TonB-dependent receptor [Dysgonamonadaceae bacterium]|jgi:TonB-linked SusC/RagA family outer membrane protein|nr:TonB-dependent receptor [Dysgonamonadaceae bacterium]
MKKTILSVKRILFLAVAVCIHSTLLAQSKTVTGKVTDPSGESIIGVSVAVKGTTTGTVTNLDGEYSIGVPESNSVLVFSYIGMVTQEIVPASNILDVVLQEAAQDLDELVVIGYGVVKKRDLTGAVASLKASEIERVASNNAMEAMQGKIAGLDITKSSGAAGSGINIDLRGNRSISASNTPLILVDGVEYGSTIDLNTSDIESMEILKDASSTAIYGTRGANGVVIITTKRGLPGTGARKTRINYNGYVSANSPTNVPRVMTAEQDVRFLIEKQRYTDEKNNGNAWGTSNPADYSAQSVISGSVLDLYNQGVSVDWFDLILHNSTSQNHELSVSGGGEKTAFNFSLGYLNENGLMKNDALDRYNMKLNIDHAIADNLNIGAGILYTRRNWDRREDGVYSQLVKMHALGDIKEDQPSQLAPSHTNPLLNERENHYQNQTQSNRFFGNTFLNWEIINGLSFRTMFAADVQNTFKGIYEDYMCTGRNQSNKGTEITQQNTNKYNLTWENTLNYNKTFAGIHGLQLLAGNSVNASKSLYGITSGTSGNVHFLNAGYYDLSNIDKANLIVESEYIEQKMMSYFGRVNYKLLERYLLTASVRADGSSVLSEGNKWGYFPSVALAWRINEESFLQDANALDNLKLRLSWGKSGNAAVEPYGTLTTLTTFYSYYSFDNSAVRGLTPGNLGNKDLTWEITTSYNAGLDFGLFNRVSGSIDVYYSKTSDLLLQKTLPPTSVYITTWDNVGSTENKGIEVALNTRNVDAKDFKWSSDWAFSLNRDKITSLASGLKQDISDSDRALIVGEPVLAFYDYETLGAWGTGEAAEAAVYGKTPGELKVKDQQKEGEDGYGVIDENDRILFNRSPNFIFGWNNHFSYKNLSLSVLTFARIGQWINYDFYSAFNPTVADGTPDLDYWTPENQGAHFPRPGIANTAEYSGLNNMKASYWKIKDITLAYDLPKTWLKKAGIANLKVYGSMKNYFTFSNIDNYDPERGGSISNPLMKQIVFGLNLEF